MGGQTDLPVRVGGQKDLRVGGQTDLINTPLDFGTKADMDTYVQEIGQLCTSDWTNMYT